MCIYNVLASAYHAFASPPKKGAKIRIDRLVSKLKKINSSNHLNTSIAPSKKVELEKNN